MPLDFNAGLQQLYSEAEGTYELMLAPTDTLPSFLREKSGIGGRYVSVFQRFLKGVFTAASGEKPVLCLTCDTALRLTPTPAVLGVIHARRSDPHVGFGFGFWKDCAGAEPDLMALGDKAILKMREVFPDLVRLDG